MGEERTERLTRRTGKAHGDRILRQTAMAETLRHFTRKHGTGRAVHVADDAVDLDRLTLVEGRSGLPDQGTIKDIGNRMHLTLGPVGCLLRRIRLVEDTAEIKAACLPVFDHRILVEEFRLADDLVKLADPHGSHDLAHFLGNEEEVVDDMLRRALEALAQDRVLCRHADRAGVEMALAHHDAASRNQRSRREAEFVSPQQRADDDITPGLQTAIHLQGYARTQAIQHQGLMRLGKTGLPRAAGMFERCQR